MGIQKRGWAEGEGPGERKGAGGPSPLALSPVHCLGGGGGGEGDGMDGALSLRTCRPFREARREKRGKLSFSCCAVTRTGEMGQDTGLGVCLFAVLCCDT